MKRWTVADIPDQAGRQIVVTGSTGGLGYETALALAGANGDVILAGRNPAKGAAALARIRRAHPVAHVRFELLDLASLASVAAFAERLLAAGAGLDVLVNNAGVMALPQRRATEDGFEMQLGTNHLGHFALTARLLPLLRQGTRPRVVSVASIVAQRGRIDFDDLQGERRYVPWTAYAQSKLAALLFAFEMQRRSEAGGWGVLSAAAHPGWARTDLVANGPSAGGPPGLVQRAMDLFAPILGQSAASGALPLLYAATAAGAGSASYTGPAGMGELKGWPGQAKVPPAAADRAVAKRFWAVSERLTGVVFPA